MRFALAWAFFSDRYYFLSMSLYTSQRSGRGVNWIPRCFNLHFKTDQPLALEALFDPFLIAFQGQAFGT